MRVRHWSVCSEMSAVVGADGAGAGDVDLVADADGSGEADDGLVGRCAGDVGADRHRSILFGSSRDDAKPGSGMIGRICYWER